MKSDTNLPMVTSEEAMHKRDSQHRICRVQQQQQLRVLNLAAEQQTQAMRVMQCQDKTTKGQAAAFTQGDYG